MGDLIPFIPSQNVEAAENVTAFIKMCRNELTVFGSDLDFDSNVWDITSYVEIRGKTHRHRLIFNNYDRSKKMTGAPMAEPFLSFAKAYMRYMQSMRPTKSYAHRLSALRSLERALSEQDVPCIERADALIFNRAASLVIEKFNRANYPVARELQAIATFCTKFRLTIAPITWRHPVKRPDDKNKVGLDAENDRQEKLPSQAALDALPKIFHAAKSTQDVIVTSIVAILFANPCRISEVLTLPTDCEVVQTDKDGKKIYGLRWLPAKGAEPMIKWIIPAMVDVVKEAISRVRKITDKAREVAKWYEMHPGQIYLPEELKHLREYEFLSISEIRLILGLLYDGTVYKMLQYKKVQNHNRGYRFVDIERVLLSKLPNNFPMLNKDINLRYSDALFIIRKNEMADRKPTYNCVVEPIGIGIINNNLGSRVQFGVCSIFERFGYTEPDGTPIKVTTHKFRHYLNTIAQRGGLSQLDIAKWSGRTDIRQNQAYDHMTNRELLLMLRESAGADTNMFNLPAEAREKTPISREEFITMHIPAAHTTELGFCIHDWTMLPCQLHRDCVSCTEHIYIKGDSRRMERIRKCLAEAEIQLAMAEEAFAQEFSGANRWTDHQKAIVARLKNLVQLFDDPNIPDEALIRLSASGAPSWISMAIEERKKLDLKYKATIPRST